MILGADWWEALTAFGTVGAVIVAISIALIDASKNRLELRRHRKKAEERTAALVSAWIETEYVPSENGTRYEKISILYLANQSDEPVYDVQINVAVQPPFRQVGPLAVPSPIPTVAPRSTRSWDISPGLMAHDAGEGEFTLTEPVARINFTDPRRQRWLRNYRGELDRDSGKKQLLNTAHTPENELQIGLFSRLNPLIVAMAFLKALQDAEKPDVNSFPGTLDPNAKGWHQLTSEDWHELARATSSYALPAHVWYRTPRVAYVRVLDEAQLEQPVNTADGGVFSLDILTLVFRRSTGWRVFSFGASAPEWIEFSPGETQEPFRTFLDEEA